MSRRIVGPFNRVEGDLEMQLEISDGEVKNAWVVSPMYRGFEQILQGKEPRDALVYTPRICGICSVSQSVASARAIADAQKLPMPANGTLSHNLLLANENAADHLTHFYLFFMPDFVNDVYAKEPWYGAAAQRFQAIKGSAIRELLPARAEFMHLMGLLAGKWPHSLAIQPGGSSRPIEVQEKARIQAILYSFRQFLESTLFGDSLERIVALDSSAALESWTTEGTAQSSDFRHFLHISAALGLERLGRAADRFMSYGAYRDHKGEPLFAEGSWDGGLGEVDHQQITEDLSHSWMRHQAEPKHPYEGITLPDAEAEGGYSWCKAPRMAGEVMEVGALARQQVAGHPLIRDLVQQSGGNVRNRVIARLLEVARLVIAMEQWSRELTPKEPFCYNAPMPKDAVGCGLVEAARGGLGHWIKIKKGRILNYQIIAPTTWNFSPRDAGGTPGALEQALVGATVREGEVDPVSVQHIVRSFDPCMVCTVH
ncbi:MAG: nickel-dependent hydrogenase large subunit [Candidatus Sedimenticola sp. (ex Thyasira tokunagai)]